MSSTIIVGVIFFGIIALASKKFYDSIKNNTCGGCSRCSLANQKAKNCK